MTLLYCIAAAVVLTSVLGFLRGDRALPRPKELLVTGIVLFVAIGLAEQWAGAEAGLLAGLLGG